MIWTDQKKMNQWRELLHCERELDQDLLRKERAFLTRLPGPREEHIDFVADTLHYSEHEGVHYYRLEVMGQNACDGHKIESTVTRRLNTKHQTLSELNHVIKLRDSTWVQIDLLRDEKDLEVLIIEVRNHETKALLHTLSVTSRAAVEAADFWIAIDSSQKGYVDRVYISDAQSIWRMDLGGKCSDWIVDQAPLYVAPQGWQMSKPMVSLESQGGGMRLYFWIKNVSHSELIALIDSSSECLERRFPDKAGAAQKLLTLDKPVSKILLRQNYLAFHTHTEIYVLNPEGFMVEKIPLTKICMSNVELVSSLIRVRQLGHRYVYEILSNGTLVAASQVMLDSERLGRRTYIYSNVKAN